MKGFLFNEIYLLVIHVAKSVFVLNVIRLTVLLQRYLRGNISTSLDVSALP